MGTVEYRYCLDDAKGTRRSMLFLLGFLLVIYLVMVVTSFRDSNKVLGILSAAFGVLAVFMVAGIVVSNRRIAYRGVVLGLSDSELRYSPGGRVPLIIPWSRVVRVRREENQGNVSVGIDYLDARGRECEVVISLGILDCVNTGGISSLILEQAERFASVRPQIVPRSHRLGHAVRRGLFRFSLFTWVLPGCVYVAEVLAARGAGRAGTVGPFTYLYLKWEYGPVLLFLMCLGCLAFVFWGWLQAKHFAQRTDERGGKLSTSARWLAGLCSIIAIVGATLLWRHVDRLDPDIKEFMFYCYWGGGMGLVYCVWLGRNRDLG
jgi:nicotinamide riboside transporter PnuC